MYEGTSGPITGGERSDLSHSCSHIIFIVDLRKPTGQSD